ncbi:MAG: hypothetical protein IJY96_03880, partial [Oscillospiraceae bacterium]|nr:hypothetical protein [Oscillospiraceae bacterium]
VDEDDFDADELKQGDILHYLHFKLVIYHGVAAVFNDNDFAVEALDLGQSLNYGLGSLVVGEFGVHGWPPIRCGNRR